MQSMTTSTMARAFPIILPSLLPRPSSTRGHAAQPTCGVGGSTFRFFFWFCLLVRGYTMSISNHLGRQDEKKYQVNSCLSGPMTPSLAGVVKALRYPFWRYLSSGQTLSRVGVTPDQSAVAVETMSFNKSGKAWAVSGQG